MTIDQAIAKLEGEIAALLEDRLDALALRMLGDGVDPTKLPANEDSDGDWHQVSFDEILERQRAIDAAWTTKALAQIRNWLEAEYCGARRDADGSCCH